MMVQMVLTSLLGGTCAGDNKGAEKVPDAALQTRSLLRIIIGGRQGQYDGTNEE